jgi:hypothetical protein
LRPFLSLAISKKSSKQSQLPDSMGWKSFEQDFIAQDANPREVGEMIRAMGLEITIFQPFP